MTFDEFAKGTAGIIAALLGGIAAILRSRSSNRVPTAETKQPAKRIKQQAKRPEGERSTPHRARLLGASIAILICLVAATLLALRLLPPFFDDDAVQTVEITQVPPAGQSPPDGLVTISGVVGRVRNVNEHYVVIYAYTNRWYVQPFLEQPLTSIEANGLWTNTTHRGSEYAALLVSKSYRPPNSLEALPVAGGDVLAIDKRPGRKP